MNICADKASGEYGAGVEENSCLTDKSSEEQKHKTESQREPVRYVKNRNFTQTVYMHKLFIVILAILFDVIIEICYVILVQFYMYLLLAVL